MPGPQVPYTHPGPSNYYQQLPQPMPPYPYPTANGHAPGPYPYGYPPQGMNGHAHIPPGSPRTHGRGRGGYHGASRGGHGPNYQNYHPLAHPHHPPSHAPYLHHPAPHMSIPHPHSHSHSPQPSPTSPYPHHQPPKFVQPHAPPPAPYSPSYGPVQNGYSPQQNWQMQQPISPLPKQLSMPPPPVLSPLGANLPPPRILDGPLDEGSTEIALPAPLPERPPAQQPKADATGQPANNPAPVASSSPGSSPSRPQSPEQAKAASRPSSPHSTAGSAAPSVTASTSSAPPQTGGWAIWSRRPDDPTRAPGIIISPRACPPEDVIQRALQISTPPPSPPAPLIALPDDPPVDEAASSKAKDVEDSPRNQTDVLSSSTTDVSTAPDTPTPGSPLSTNTSVSVAGTASKADSKSPTSPKPLVDVPPAVKEASPAEEASASSSEPAPAPASEPSKSTPAPAPVPAVKKSWASLLRSDGGTASTSKGALPTSSVVGFSIPASPPPARVPPVRRPELLSILSGSVPPSGPPVIRPRGLVNLGNMCFANAVLQLLVYCPPFWRLFGELSKVLPEGAEGEGATPLADATVKFLREFVPDFQRKGGKKGKEVEETEEDESVDSFIPAYVYDAMKEKKRFDTMRGGHQEDAEEFFGFYLDTLEEELLSLSSTHNPKTQAAPHKVEEREEETPQDEGWMEVGKRNKMVLTRTVKSVESPITRIFGGKFRSTLRVPQQRDSVVVEDWRSLQLDIQRDAVHTIRDALSYISQPQSVQIVSPTRPGMTVDATQQIFIEALPPILVLHLKRFLYDTNAKGVVKIGKKVQFTPELEIPSDIMAPGKRNHPARYQLYGVLYHHGLSASGGHYTLDVLHPNRDMSTSGGRPREAWIRIDDELVSDVRPEDVFGGLEQDDRCAYLLFYRRVAGWGRT